jgi:hypothetical protein
MTFRQRMLWVFQPPFREGWRAYFTLTRGRPFGWYSDNPYRDEWDRSRFELWSEGWLAAHTERLSYLREIAHG